MCLRDITIINNFKNTNFTFPHCFKFYKLTIKAKPISIKKKNSNKIGKWIKEGMDFSLNPLKFISPLHNIHTYNVHLN